MLGNDVNLRIGATDKTSTAFRSAETRMNRLAGTAKAMAGSLGMGLGVAAFTRLAKSAIDYGSAITDAAIGTRVGIEEYQVIAFAAQDAGTSMDKVTMTLAKIQKATNDAKNGLTTYTRAFDALGINVDQFQQLSPDQQFVELGRAMVDSKDQAVAYASIMDIIGSRNAPRLMEVLKRLGTDGYDAVATAAKEAGQVMSEETAKNMDKTADIIERAGTRITNVFASMISGWMEFNEKIGVTLADLNAGPAVNAVSTSALQMKVTAEEALRIAAAIEDETEGLNGWLNPDIVVRAEKITGAIKEQSGALDDQLATRQAIQEIVAAAEELQAMEELAALQQIVSDNMDTQTDAYDSWVQRNLNGQEMLVHAMKNASDSMTDSFMEFCESGKLNFSSFVESMMKDIARLVFQQQVSNPIAQMISGGIGNLFGGGFSVSADGTSGGGGGGWFSGGRAAGGTVMGGRSYLVGEKGPEIMTTRSGGTVIPNDALGGGGTTIHFNVTAIDSASFSQHLAKHQREITGIVENAHNRRGKRGPLTA